MVGPLLAAGDLLALGVIMLSGHSDSGRRAGHRIRRTMGLMLLIVGAFLTLGTGGLHLYAYYVDGQMSQLMDVPTPTPPIEATAIVVSAEATPTPMPLLPPLRVRIPSIDLDAKVVEVGTRVKDGQLVWEVPAHAVGHYRTTALPGQGGNVVMAGHISSPFEGSVFRRLPYVQVGDMVVVETERAVFNYRVVSREIVSPNAVRVMEPTSVEMLTLLTCYPDLVFSHRLVVRAVPVG